MQKEIIIHNNKKVTKTTKNNGSISFTQRGVYIGIDIKSGKKVTASITAKTLRSLDRKIIQARLNFEAKGSTLKETFVINNFEDLAEAWFTSFTTWVSSQNTINRVRGYLDTYIIPKFGEYKPETIKSADIQLWIKIPPKPKPPKERIMVLHEEDLATWLNFLDNLADTRANRRFKVICDTLLASALRISELLALTIQDLDFDANEIIVNKTLMWKRGNKKLGIKGEVICKHSAKTDSGNRRVAVPRQTLKDLQAFHNEMNLYFDKHSLPKTDLIFPTIYGNYMCDRNERATLKKRLTSLGLPNYGFHLFRHTHASLMLNAGANWKELQARMGHKSIKTTMDTYAELAPKKKSEAVEIYLREISKLTS